MSRKWIFALVAMAAVALVMFPLNLLLVGHSPAFALVRSLLFGLPALLTVWVPRERRSATAEGKPARQLSRPAKIACGVTAVVVPGAMFVHDACSEGLGVGITNAVGFVLLICVAVVGYKCGYLKY